MSRVPCVTHTNSSTRRKDLCSIFVRSTESAFLLWIFRRTEEQGLSQDTLLSATLTGWTCTSSYLLEWNDHWLFHSTSSYDRPPQDEVTLDEFETYAIDRLRVLAEIESCWVRNRSPEELKSVTQAQCRKYLPMDANTARGADLDAQRKKDIIGHFVLRLAFCRSWAFNKPLEPDIHITVQ